MSLDSVKDLAKEMKRIEERSRGRAVPSFRLIGDRDRNELNYLIEKLRRFVYIADKTPHEPINVYCHHFPLLLLPNKLISRIFSFLSIRDRLNARVNKKLNAIELQSKHFVKFLHMAELPAAYRIKRLSLPKKDNSIYVLYRHHQRILLEGNDSFSSDLISRISQNVTIGKLRILIDIRGVHYREILSLLNKINVDSLVLNVVPYETSSSPITESLLLDLAKSCRELSVECLKPRVDPQFLLSLYKVMMNGTGKLRHYSMRAVGIPWLPFMALVGISSKDGVYYSSTKDIQVFERDEGNGVRIMKCFDKNFELSITRYPKGGKPEVVRSDLELRSHESQESLDSAKKNFVRFSVVME
ncbi:hypothetical protein PMAYCL1PPCAC_27969 [Pristionchus mayeri]|uniref:F-box domain-containing protein n=1 Tax=Pristionchus mayeri TaxID=1317129 RepID=A0AAN5D958_9BILA|nr:hypothetical protein PMAYCL1PPCAC_27969 [Pristionchus mayeri]